MSSEDRSQALLRLPKGMLERAALLDAWDAARHKACHLLLGTAGSGKTTLALQWRQRLVKQGFDVAWLAAQADDEGGALTASLFAALGAVSTDICQQTRLPYHREGGPLAPGAVAVSLIRGIARHARQLMLVIDDYHTICQAPVHTLLQALLDYGPPNLHLLIVSRHVPSLALERHRAAGQVHTLDVGDLRFTLAEVGTFTQQRALPLNGEGVRRLHHLTDGWAAGLQLFALGMKSQPRRTEWTEPVRTPHEFVAYFNREVLGHLTPQSLEGLVRLSPARRFNEPLAGAMLGAAQGQALMTLLQRERLFVMPVGGDGEDGWWGFHPLLRDLLMERFEDLPHEDRKRTRRRLGDWFGQHGRLRDAVQHLVAAGEIPQAADWIDRHARRLFVNGELQALVRAMSELPPSVLRERRALTLWRGWTQLCYRDLPACRESIARLDHQETHEADAAHLNLLKFSLTLQTDALDQSEALLPAMLQMRHDDDAVLEGGRRNLLAWYFSHRGAPAQGRRMLDGPKPCRDDGHLLLDSSFGSLMGDALRGMTHLFEGCFQPAESTLRAALAHAQRLLGSHCEAACTAAGFLCEVLYEVNDLQGLRQLLEQFADVLEPVALPDAQFSAARASSRLLALSGHFIEAHEALMPLDDMAQHRDMPRMAAAVVHAHFELCLRAGDEGGAQQHLSTLEALSARAADHGPLLATRITQHADLAHAQWAFHQWRTARSLSLLARLLDAPSPDRTVRWQARALHALACAREGQADLASAAALQLLRQAQACGQVRSLLDLGDDFLQLLARLDAECAQDPMLGFYREHLLAQAAQGIVPGSATPARRAGIQSLSEREQQILRLLTNALPNKRIAQALGISPDTVKWHVKNLYPKLGVISREEAVAAARELGMAPSRP